MYGAVDPIYMLMLIKNLGPGFVVWDKSATIRFRRPGRKALFATFRLAESDLEAIRADVARDGKAEPRFLVELKDDAGEVCATCEKLLSVRGRSADEPARREGPAEMENGR